MKRKSTGDYPRNWPDIANEVKAAAGWRCIRCQHPHDPASGHTLTVHHADICPDNCRWWNLLALCQRCHLTIQSKMVFERPWLLEHSDWFKPYVGGWSAWHYLGVELTREQVEADLDYYAGLQRAMLVEVQA